MSLSAAMKARRIWTCSLPGFLAGVAGRLRKLGKLSLLSDFLAVQFPHRTSGFGATDKTYGIKPTCPFFHAPIDDHALSPWRILEVFNITSTAANAHLAGAILVDPFAPVPGPIVGAGLPEVGRLLHILSLWLAIRGGPAATSPIQKNSGLPQASDGPGRQTEDTGE
jgi:hypothetical protein